LFSLFPIIQLEKGHMAVPQVWQAAKQGPEGNTRVTRTPLKVLSDKAFNQEL